MYINRHRLRKIPCLFEDDAKCNITMKRILITILAAVICLCSCEKQEQSHWLHNLWNGEYDITMTNNDTGEKEPHVGVISLEFSDDRSECIVEGGVKDLLAITRTTYKAI